MRNLGLFKNLNIEVNSPHDQILKTESYFICNDVYNESELLKWVPFAKKYGIHSAIILPFRKSGKIIGTLNLYSEKIEFSDNEEIALFIEVATDISFAIDLFEKAKKHKETEELVLKNERLFRALIEKSTDVKTLSDKNGKLIYASSSITKVLGYKLEEFLDISIFNLVHPDDLDCFLEKRKEIESVSGKYFDFEQRFLHKNGNWIWCEGTVTNMIEEKNVNAFVGNFRDITEKKKAEKDLLKSENFSRNILNSLSSHIAVINHSGTIIAVNEAWNRFALVNGETTLENTSIGSNYLDVCKKSTIEGDKIAPKVLIGLQKVMTKKKDVFYLEYPCHMDTKEEIWFALLAVPFDGEEDLVVIAHQDISQRKINEDELIKNNEILSKTNLELDRFVYSVSHDLRSPLTSILGLLSFIEEESKEEDTLEHTSMIRNSVNRLDEYIKNILIYSRNNRMELDIKKIPVQKIIEEIFKEFKNIKSSEKISYEVNIKELVPFYSDKQSLNTILENLISNAIKFQNTEQPNKFIKITGTIDKEYLHLLIADNGIGIAKQHQNKIFDMFFRLSGKVDGTGIGLYIVKEIIKKLKGTIEVSSKQRIGTAFSIILKNLKP
jgi:PAS domain S-box-containing protein